MNSFTEYSREKKPKTKKLIKSVTEHSIEKKRNWGIVSQNVLEKNSLKIECDEFAEKKKTFERKKFSKR